MARVLRRRRSDRHLQRQDVRRAGDGDALAVPPHGDAARRRAALRHAARGAAAVEGRAGRTIRREGGCRLSTLERALFDVRRVGDVAGIRDPVALLPFLRSGDPRPLEPVLEHNRLDLVSLAAVTARAVRLVEEGADGCRDARRRWRSDGSTSARARSIAPRRAIAAPRRADDRRRCEAKGCIGSACAAGASGGSPKRRTAGAQLLDVDRIAARRSRTPAGRRCGSSRSRRSRSITSIASATCRRRASWRCSRWRSGDRGRPPARGRLSPPAGAARAKDGRKSKTLSSSGAERLDSSRRVAGLRLTPWRPTGCFLAFAAALRLSEVCAPNRLVKRSTRPSVSISFCRPVKNGWQLLQISRCSSGLVERVVQRRAARAAGHDFVVLRVNPFLHSRLLRGSGEKTSIPKPSCRTSRVIIASPYYVNAYGYSKSTVRSQRCVFSSAISAGRQRAGRR